MKAELLKRICDDLERRLEAVRRSLMEAHAAATDPGSKAEGKYDTRSLEQSYLAAGQQRQLDEMVRVLRVLSGLELPDFSGFQPVDAGALVEVESAAGRVGFFLVPAGGGHELEDGGMLVTLLTPESPLYGRLLGLYVGDELEQPRLKVLSVR